MNKQEIINEIIWRIGDSPGRGRSTESLVEEYPNLMEEVARAFRRQREEEDWNFRRDF